MSLFLISSLHEGFPNNSCLWDGVTASDVSKLLIGHYMLQCHPSNAVCALAGHQNDWSASGVLSVGWYVFSVQMTTLNIILNDYWLNDFIDFFYVFPTTGCHITCVFHYYHSVLCVFRTAGYHITCVFHYYHSVLLCLSIRWLPYHMCFPLLSQCSFMSFQPMVAISHVFSIIITVFFYVFPTDGCHITCVFHY